MTEETLWRKGIKEIEIDGETISVKKGKFGWSVIHPIKDKDGKIIWKNLIAGGNWFNLIKIGLVIVVIIGKLYEYSSNLKFCTKLIKNMTLIK